jgi:hypothetical protein
MRSHKGGDTVSETIGRARSPRTDQSPELPRAKILAENKKLTFAAGDHIKFEIKDEATAESEWMWLRVDSCDESKRLVFGRLDSEPVVFATALKLGQQMAVSYDNVREHRKPSEY